MAIPVWMRDLDHISPWWAILVSVCGIYLAYRSGVTAGKKQERTLHLDVRRATPNIGTRAQLVYIGEGGWHKWAVRITLYNDGDLVATKLDGHWRVTYRERDTEHTIRADGLPRFLPLTMQHELHPVGQISPPVGVEIAFTYRGLDDVLQSYRTAYKNDDECRELVQTVESD